MFQTLEASTVVSGNGHFLCTNQIFRKRDKIHTNYVVSLFFEHYTVCLNHKGKLIKSAKAAK